MIVAPASVDDLASQIASASERVEQIDLSRLNQLLEHTPEDMTATVQSGMSLSALQEVLSRHGQWVPLDPPGNPTLGDLLAYDLSGPRRHGYGTVREYVIGMRAVLGSGEVIRNGGKVVKNVAGYDLCRLLIGARHTLGIIVEITFKLRPLPEATILLERHCASLGEAKELSAGLSMLEPVILDLHNLSGALVVLIGFEGTREDVESQSKAALNLGFATGGILPNDTPPHKASVLPSTTFEFLESLGRSRFVARLGNGVIYSDVPGPAAHFPEPLTRRVKEAFDPKGILPDFSSVRAHSC